MAWFFILFATGHLYKKHVVFTKCKAHLENGRRLENMSWRLWYHEKNSNSSSSSTTSSAAYFSCMSAVVSSFDSSTSSSFIPAYSTSPAAASTTSTINTASIHNTNTCVKRFISSMEHQEDWSRHSHQQHNTTKAVALDTNNNNNATNGTTQAAVSATDASITKQTSNNGTLQRSHDRQAQQSTLQHHHQEQQQQQSAISHHSTFKPRVSIIQIDPGDDEDEDHESLDNVDNDDRNNDDNFFNKSKPVQRSSASRPSLLTAMLRNDTCAANATGGSAAPKNTKSARDHFLCKELSESLRRNVLWEQIQQRALYPNQLYRHHPAAVGIRSRKQQEQSRGVHSNRNNLQHTEWLESFHGW